VERVEQLLVKTSKQTTKQHPLLGNRFLIGMYKQPLASNAFTNKHVPTETVGVQQHTVSSTQCVPRCYKQGTSLEVVRVETGSNTSTVTLRVVGGDEKRSLESETVKYGHESYGTRT
jgi:hypothetical protein